MTMRVKLAALLLAAMLGLSACAQQESGSSGASSEASPSASAAAPASSASSPADVVAIGSEGVVTILLDYSAGTGFEWTFSEDPEGLVDFVGKETEGMSDEDDTTGGPLRDRFTFRAQKSGEVVLTFDLVREWEGDPAETQVYAFTIGEDLSMTVNPYKSQFDHEPEWGSNS